MSLFRKRDPSERVKPQNLDETGILDLPYLVLTILLACIGVLMMFSASYAKAYYDTGNSAYYFVRQVWFAAGGIAVTIIIGRLNYFIWHRLSLLILGAAILLLAMVLIPGVGVTHNGATRWLRIGIEFQPSEIAKLAVILTFASFMSVFQDRMGTFTYGVLPYVLILGVVAGLLVLQKHLSATLIICLIGAFMMMIGGTRWPWFVVLGVVFGIFLLIYLSSRGYAGGRVTAWKNPESDPRGAGYQIIQSKYAISSGGLLGLGFGKSHQKYLYLPEAQNDYIFAIVCEELGLIGASVVMLLFIFLILRGYWIAIHARDRFGTLIAAGFSTKLAIQVFFNIGVVTNFLPATGISLPFFSYGGTALLLQMFEMGIVLSVSRWCTNKQAIGRRKA
ncbi:MAG: putative lipid II flippase FtsW [Oscillospiraceae bacterium]|nr:putative lipid II flippase FtsW [Oscillospiraceae bacterium]